MAVETVCVPVIVKLPTETSETPLLTFKVTTSPTVPISVIATTAVPATPVVLVVTFKSTNEPEVAVSLSLSELVNSKTICPEVLVSLVTVNTGLFMVIPCANPCAVVVPLNKLPSSKVSLSKLN